jgi:hypothetical protein
MLRLHLLPSNTRMEGGRPHPDRSNLLQRCTYLHNRRYKKSMPVDRSLLFRTTTTCTIIYRARHAWHEYNM